LGGGVWAISSPTQNFGGGIVPPVPPLDYARDSN